MSILRYPDPILDSKSISVYENLNLSDLKSLTDEMYSECWNVGGFGISAVQIGKPLRIFGYFSKNRNILNWICDPELISAYGNIFMHEGCLSIPGYFWSISRYEKVTIKFRDLSGKERIKTFKSLESRVVQHEMDHLDGILIPDLMNENDRNIFNRHYSDGSDVYSYTSPHIFV